MNFRETMCRYAAQVGVTGWVRNCSDGSVEAFAQGDPVALEDILQWARLGSPHSHVDSLDTEEAAPDPSLKSFERRDTA